jgi:hypothetical protein
MAFLRYWLSLVAGMGAFMLLALVPLGIGWLVERASGSPIMGLVVTLLAITLGTAAVNWWIWGTATGDRCVAWLARTIGPPSRH